ncbi:uncharacterized protein LOC111866509 [Cryptotermes secundus]|uniref:uncharacterized protein LOC111866509 n=1 Tax=Cryptotermes secundus TaxID=105785 RepID=UPI000CD7C25A|nr:uncharacterized protein LOC111866509 [Cryptotermes secundus]
MLDYVRKGHVEIAEPIQNSKESYYPPHHLVKKERRGNSKWRIVFDGSSREQYVPSLNDALEMGPNLLPETLSILLRFRLYPSAIIGDVSQAFLQLILDHDDRDLTRFLWYRVVGDDEHGYETTSDITTYRFKRLPFGLTCSPFLLAATLRELADRYKQTFPHAASLMVNSTYVDDFAAGAENEVEVIALYYELTSLMRQIPLPMAKWASISTHLKTVWTAEGQRFDAETQVLGIDWNTETDTFSIDHEVITNKVAKGPTTKRNVLKAAATLYDPLGLASPVSIIGKRLFQDTWCRGMGWDELLPQDFGLQWHTWVATLPSLSSIHIPRCVHTSEDGDSHTYVFCDASERAYGAALYIRTEGKDRVRVQLVCSKNRLVPVKKVTLPRLELLAALISARLLRCYCRETGFHSQAATLWTDSMVTLGWICEDPNRWRTFVCNGVTEIQTCPTPSQWRHCPGESNPADHLSRGITADRLKSLDKWRHGPSWLSLPPREWPKNLPTSSSPLPDEKRPWTQPVLLLGVHSSLIDATRFSSYWKLIRTTAWIFRFKQSLLRRERFRGELTAAELAAARAYWIQTVQEECFAVELYALRNNTPLPEESKIACFNPFLDSGLIRLGGRLHFAPLTREQRHPLLLDGQHHFTKLLIQQTHIRLHHLGLRMVLSELRDEFWILRARQTIKKALRHCLPCKIAKNTRGQESEGPLPADRLKPTKPFTVTGVDFAGPLYLKVGSLTQKAYIVLFTCATTRDLHLELASDMSTDKFLMAFRRFSGRRGIPHTI